MTCKEDYQQHQFYSVPPPQDEEVLINHLGAVVMNYRTFEGLINDSDRIMGNGKKHLPIYHIRKFVKE